MSTGDSQGQRRSAATSGDGILLLHKQAGMTSFDCIRTLKRTLGRTDIGHGGTLDKFATGLLPIFVGEGLKLARFFLENHPTLPTYWKSYSGVFEFGTSTETGDPEGEVLERREGLMPSLGQLNAAMAGFCGQSYEQLPPRYSAKKIDGARASDLARQGKEPELKAVPVVIKRFVCTGIEGHLVRFEVECSKGTYVRSLAVDLAKRLGTIAYTKELKRTAIGGFSLSEALTLEQVAEAVAQNKMILDMTRSTAFLPGFELSQDEQGQLAVGVTTSICARLAGSGFAPGAYCARAADGRPLAFFELGTDHVARFLRRMR